MDFQPPISIIVAVKNAKKDLEKTLKSIEAQNYHKLETIVIDGDSTDGTLDLILPNKHIIKQFVSEPDEGISDAFNKGVSRATGMYLYFLGAGDTFASDDAIQQLFADCDPSHQLICGKVMRVAEDGETPLWIAPKKYEPFKKRSLWFKMSLPHQGLFTHRDFFEKVGQFDTSVKFAMDYELLLRAFKDFPKICVKDVLVARWQAGGIGSNRIYEILDEYHRIKQQHCVAPKLVLMAINLLNRLKYFVKGQLLKQAY